MGCLQRNYVVGRKDHLPSAGTSQVSTMFQLRVLLASLPSRREIELDA